MNRYFSPEYSGEAFQLFSASHLAVMAIVVLANVLLYLLFFVPCPDNYCLLVDDLCGGIQAAVQIYRKGFCGDKCLSTGDSRF